MFKKVCQNSFCPPKSANGVRGVRGVRGFLNAWLHGPSLAISETARLYLVGLRYSASCLFLSHSYESYRTGRKRPVLSCPTNMSGCDIRNQGIIVWKRVPLASCPDHHNSLKKDQVITEKYKDRVHMTLFLSEPQGGWYSRLLEVF